MPDDEDFAQPITLYGHGTYFAEHQADAAVYPETRDAVIARAQLVCPASAIMEVEASLEDQPEAVRLLARRFIKDIQIVVLPDSLGERMDEDLLADLLHMASGWTLLRAIDGACHGYPVGDPEPWDDRGFIPAVTVTQEVCQILMGAGIQAIRYHDDIGNWWLGQQAGEVGPLYFILDQSVLRFERLARASEPQEHGPLVSVETARTASLLNRAWLTLDEDAQLAICAVVGACRRRGDAQAAAFRGGHVFAQIDPRGAISWAVNDASDDCVASGVLRRHANQVLCVESFDDLKFLADTWREIGDPYAETQDPARAKALLATITGDGQAGLAWTAGIGGDEAEEAYRWLDIIEAQRAALDAAITAHRADVLWGRAFDAAESQADTRAEVLSTLAARLVGLADTAAQTEAKAITPELTSGQLRGR